MPGVPWSAEDMDVMRERYPHTRTAVLAGELGRTTRALYEKALQMGLRKSEEYLNGPESGRLSKRDNRGKCTRFAKGHKTWNKGVAFDAGGNSVSTRFQQGSKPHNWVPVGAERVTPDGYTQRKLTDTGYPPRDWKGLHVLLWEEHHGPLEKGMVVVFRNGNKQDLRIENLEALTRQQNMRRNSVQRFPRELRRVIQQRAALVRRINRMERDEKQD